MSSQFDLSKFAQRFAKPAATPPTQTNAPAESSPSQAPKPAHSDRPRTVNNAATAQAEPNTQVPADTGAVGQGIGTSPHRKAASPLASIPWATREPEQSKEKLDAENSLADAKAAEWNNQMQDEDPEPACAEPAIATMDEDMHQMSETRSASELTPTAADAQPENHNLTSKAGLRELLRTMTAPKSASTKAAMLHLGIKPSHIELALQRQRITHEELPAIMRDLGLMGTEKVAQVLAMEQGLPYFAPSMAKQIDLELIQRYTATEIASSKFVPLTVDDANKQPVVYIAIASHQHINDAANMAYSKRLQARFVMASAETIQGIFRKFFAQTADEFDKAMQENREDQGYNKRLLDALLRHACFTGASDIHITPSESAGMVVLRYDGVGMNFRVLDKLLCESFTTKLKNDNSIQDLSIPKEASIKNPPEDLAGRYNFRLEMAQTVSGVTAVIRVLDRHGSTAELEQIGFDPETLSFLRGYTNKANGLVLVTGPTGSGKTTSLYAMLKEIDPIERSVQTIENPSEYRCGLWKQHEIRRGEQARDEGEEWGLIFKGILRNDPDVCLLGEVRDSETANTMIDAANTGHLVFTTLHTNSAASAIPRLFNLDVDPDLLSSVLLGVLAQRLVRALCPHCKLEDDRRSTMEELESANHLRGLKHHPFRAQEGGCPACQGTGYQGRIIIYELLHASEKVRKLIAEKQNTAELVATIQDGNRMWGYGMGLVASGKTSMDELARVAQKE